MLTLSDGNSQQQSISMFVPFAQLAGGGVHVPTGGPYLPGLNRSMNGNNPGQPYFAPHIREMLPGGGERVSDPISSLLEKRVIMMNYGFDDFVIGQVIAQILYLDSVNNNDIKIYINSGGGSVTAGFALENVMRLAGSRIVTIGMGMCASMGAFALNAGTQGSRCALPDTTVMVHQASYGTEGKITHMEAHMKWARHLNQTLIQKMAERSGQSFQFMFDLMREDNFLTAQDALNYGLIDRIIDYSEAKV